MFIYRLTQLLLRLFVCLRVCFQIGVNPDDAQAVKAHTSINAGIWNWSSQSCDRTHQLKFNDCADDKKRLIMLSYAWECFGDLCLARADNVSESPGF